MSESSEEADLVVIDNLIAAATSLLADCDRYGLALIAIDISSAIDKLQAQRNKLV